MPTHRFAITVLMVSLLGTDACASHSMRGSLEAQPTEAPVVVADLQQVVDTTFTRSEPAFTLESTSHAGAEAALASLASTMNEFSAMFGEKPPAIAVVIIDSMDPARPLPTPAVDGVPTITVMSSGLSEASDSSARISFQRSLTVMASETWVAEYASRWAVPRQAVGGVVVPSEPTLPDWVYAASVHLLANEQAYQQATTTLRAHPADIMPLSELFAYHVPETSDDDLEEFLADLSIGALSRSQFREDVSPPRRETAMFLAQATSVYEYLRDVKRLDVGEGLIAPLMSGHDMTDVVKGAGLSLTMESLEAGWRHWALKTTPLDQL